MHARNRKKTNMRRHGPREVGRKTKDRWQTRIETICDGWAVVCAAVQAAAILRVLHITLATM